MLEEIATLDPELKQLEQDGYKLEIHGQYLTVSNIDYFDSSGAVRKDGALSLLLNIQGTNPILRPENHVIHFTGKYPCNARGNPIEILKHKDENREFFQGLFINYSFSNKLKDAQNHYEEFSSYSEKVRHLHTV